jgi:hypothetical protein
MIYNPDNWVVVKSPTDGHMRVLAGWSGGYTQGSSWRMNSGITKCEETEDTFEFHGSSDSVYSCIKSSYCLRMNNSHIWRQLEELGWKLMDEGNDWANMDYGVGDKQ